MNKKIIFIWLWWLSNIQPIGAQDIEQSVKEKPVKVFGSLQATTGIYLTDTFNSTQKPFQYSLTAAPILSIYGVQLPFNLVFTQGSKSINHPFAQFGLNPSYKWWKGYFGYTNMNWGDFNLNGKTFLGAGMEINPGKFRFGWMYGRLNPSIPYDSLNPGNAVQFTRSGYALKIGVGKENNFTDFIFLHGHDHQSSIPDTGNLINPPQANVLLSIRNQRSFLKEKLNWTLELNAAGICKDLRSPDFNTDSSFPIQLLKAMIPIKYATSYSWALQNKLVLKLKPVVLSAEYLRINPEYVSFGVDYMTNDLQKFALSESFTGKKYKSNWIFNQIYQHDNLNNRKSRTTGRFSNQVIWNYNPGVKFGLSFNYSLFLISQSSGSTFLADSVRLFQFNHNVMLNPRFIKTSEKNTQVFSLVIMYQGLNDENKKSIYKFNGQTFNINFSHNISINKNGLNLNSALNYLLSNNEFVQVMSFGPTFGISKSFIKDKLYSSWTSSFLYSLQNGAYSSTNMSHQLSNVFTLDKHHAFKNNFYFMLNNTSINNQHEFRGDLGYVFTF